jgi:hypothetical protein
VRSPGCEKRSSSPRGKASKRIGLRDPLEGQIGSSRQPTIVSQGVAGSLRGRPVDYSEQDAEVVLRLAKPAARTTCLAKGRGPLPRNGALEQSMTEG